METNPYKSFRSSVDSVPNVPGLLSKNYDEPTYMTFKVVFGQNSSLWSGTTLSNTNYDRMPHPLFINKQVDAEQSPDGGANVIEFNRESYSTIDFLRDSNEFSRAEMLKEFINVWEELQTNFQWSFQSIEGIDELLKVSPGRGKRVGQDLRLTFNMNESIDQRINYLLNLYRKIAWDDTYQRWVLPDVMRFFDIKIYITEFRTFHKSSAGTRLERVVGRTRRPGKSNARSAEIVPTAEPIYMEILNGILPTHLLECEMCEFDLEAFNYSYRNKVSVNEDPEAATVSFSVKVGNVNEVSTYPLFSHFIFDDRKLNGHDRTKETGFVKDLGGRILNAQDESGKYTEQVYVSTKSGDGRYTYLDSQAQDTFFQSDHAPGGAPYNESSLTNNIKNSSPNYSIVAEGTKSTVPNTWVGKAIDFGKAYGANFIESEVDKAKMTTIPGLGFSFNEGIAAIESKNFVSVLALIRKAIRDTIGSVEKPSELLDGKVDYAFKEALTELANLPGYSDSEATDSDFEGYKDIAEQALHSGILWQKIKDYSEATDLIGKNLGRTESTETNIPTILDTEYGIPTQKDYSTATDLTGTNLGRTKITEENAQRVLDTAYGIEKPSDYSTATDMQGKNLGRAEIAESNIPTILDTEYGITQPTDRSGATDLDGGPEVIQPGQIIEATPSSQLGGTIIDKQSQPAPSKATNNKIDES